MEKSPSIKKTVTPTNLAAFGRARILVVDDDPDMCEFLVTLMTRNGFDAEGLTDSTKAIGALQDGAFHLLILDMLMEGMSGTELLEQIRKMDRDLSVIVVTGYPSIENVITSLKHQAADYVRKPVEPEALLESVKRALARKGLAINQDTELQLEIGQVLRDARKSKMLTLKQLARRSGVSVSQISQIERGVVSASIASLSRLSGALEIELAELFIRR